MGYKLRNFGKKIWSYTKGKLGKLQKNQTNQIVEFDEQILKILGSQNGETARLAISWDDKGIFTKKMRLPIGCLIYCKQKRIGKYLGNNLTSKQFNFH